MDKELRGKFKKAQLRLRELKYDLGMMYGKPIAIRMKDIYDYDVENTWVEDAVKVNMYAVPTSQSKFIFEYHFSAEICLKKPTNTILDLPCAAELHDYWGKCLRIAKELTDLEILCTEKEACECIYDIKKKSRIGKCKYE